MSTGAPSSAFATWDTLAETRPHLLKIANWKGVHADAEDWVHDALLNAWRYHEGFRGGVLRDWTATLLKHRIWKLRRRQDLYERVLANLEIIHPPLRDPAHEAVVWCLLAQALALLRSYQHESEAITWQRGARVVLLAAIGLEYSEIATAMDLTVGVVGNCLHLTRARLRSDMNLEAVA